MVLESYDNSASFNMKWLICVKVPNTLNQKKEHIKGIITPSIGLATLVCEVPFYMR